MPRVKLHEHLGEGLVEFSITRQPLVLAFSEPSERLL